MRNIVQLVDLGTQPRMFDLYCGGRRIGYLVDQSKSCANIDEAWQGYVNGHGKIFDGSLCRALAKAEAMIQEGDKA